MALPLFMVFYAPVTEIHLCLYMLIAIGAALASVLLIYHGSLVAKNNTTHQKNKGTYDLGLVANLKVIFGNKWLLSLVWPFASSKLPKVYWTQVENSKMK